MNIVKTCCCGASLQVSCSPRATSRVDSDRERADALKQIERFDRQHKACIGPLPTVSSLPAPRAAV